MARINRKRNIIIIKLILLYLAVFQQQACMAFVTYPMITDIWQGIADKFTHAQNFEPFFDENPDFFAPQRMLTAIKSATIDPDLSAAKNIPFLAHICVLQELKGLYSKTRRVNTSDGIVLTDTSLTQTEAYLKCYQKEVTSVSNGYFENSFKEYAHVINQVIAQEKELSRTHYFFYHAHNRELIILHDFIKLLQSYMQLVSPRSDFACVRLKGLTFIPYKNVNEFLDAYPHFHNYDPIPQSYMISVNLALFGSHTNIAGLECTFEYFLNNQSMMSQGLNNRLDEVFSHYNLDKKYIQELTDLTSYLTSSTGNLLQICIPHNMVDDLVYLAVPGGMPYPKIVLPEHYNSYKGRHKSIKPLLEHMRTAPHEISDLANWQARLMFFDPMLDMHPEVKIFRYNTIATENMAIFQEKLKEIVFKLIFDYLKKADASKNKPLLKFYNYIKENGHFGDSLNKGFFANPLNLFN